jgi:hypothetical protein
MAAMLRQRSEQSKQAFAQRQGALLSEMRRLSLSLAPSATASATASEAASEGAPPGSRPRKQPRRAEEQEAILIADSDDEETPPAAQPSAAPTAAPVFALDARAASALQRSYESRQVSLQLLGPAYADASDAAGDVHSLGILFRSGKEARAWYAGRLGMLHVAAGVRERARDGVDPRSGGEAEVLSRSPGALTMDRRQMRTLGPGCWLKDEPINFVGELLEKRWQRFAALIANGAHIPADSDCPRTLGPAKVWTSFFYSKLAGGASGYRYEEVRRWSLPRRLGPSIPDGDLGRCEVMIFPINWGNTHWAVAALFPCARAVLYWDSLGRSARKEAEVTVNLLRWHRDDMVDKHARTVTTDDWTVVNQSSNVPLQANGYDCGAFLLAYAEHLCRPGAVSRAGVKEAGVRGVADCTTEMQDGPAPDIIAEQPPARLRLPPVIDQSMMEQWRRFLAVSILQCELDL